MKPISEGIYGLLMRQGLRAGSLAGDDARGMGAGMLEGTAHPLAAQAGENREPMGMGKRTPAETGASQQGGQHQSGRNHSAKSRLHLAYVSTMPTRQGRISKRPSLVCIEGGKL